MTQVATKTASSNTVAQPPAAILRDAAFVLMMTKKVKDAMIIGKGTEPSESANNPARRYLSRGANVSAAEFMQNLSPSGAGPSGKT